MVSSKMTILIAEGDKGVRCEIRNRLRSQGFQVHEACDRYQVVHSVRCNSIDLTIIGSSRDGSWDGLDLVDEIRKRDRRLPIILVNVHSSEKRAIAALRAGVNDYFKHPYSFKNLIASIKRNLAAPQDRASIKVRASSNEPRLKGQCENPLSPAMRQILATCLALKTTEAKTLAAQLNRSPATIRTEFQRILLVLGVHSRYAALKTAEAMGWLQSADSIANPELYANAVLLHHV